MSAAQVSIVISSRTRLEADVRGVPAIVIGEPSDPVDIIFGRQDPVAAIDRLSGELARLRWMLTHPATEPDDSEPESEAVPA